MGGHRRVSAALWSEHLRGRESAPFSKIEAWLSIDADAGHDAVRSARAYARIWKRDHKWAQRRLAEYRAHVESLYPQSGRPTNAPQTPQRRPTNAPTIPNGSAGLTPAAPHERPTNAPTAPQRRPTTKNKNKNRTDIEPASPPDASVLSLDGSPPTSASSTSRRRSPQRSLPSSDSLEALRIRVFEHLGETFTAGELRHGWGVVVDKSVARDYRQRDWFRAVVGYFRDGWPIQGYGRRSPASASAGYATRDTRTTTAELVAEHGAPNQDDRRAIFAAAPLGEVLKRRGGGH